MDESIAVAPSEDNGNVPAETIAPVAPSETPAPVAPTETETTTPVAPTEPEMFELPDGRKVDAATVAQEYKNLLSDYTRKSQELAAKTKAPETLPTPPQNPYADPNYIPQTYEEIIKVAEERALQAIEAKEQARIDAQSALETAVSTQLAQVKTIDPTVNENALFLHATKYGFRDLTIAHQNMRDMSEMAKKVKQTTANDITKRTDPVSVSPGATGARPNPSNFNTAIDYLRSLK